MDRSILSIHRLLLSHIVLHHRMGHMGILGIQLSPTTKFLELLGNVSKVGKITARPNLTVWVHNEPVFFSPLASNAWFVSHA